MNLETKAKITWCPGCGNFGILNSLKMAVGDLVKEGKARVEDFVLVAGIGCHGKIVDYVNLNSFVSLHGRAVPTATGIKLANPKLKVIAFAGDGDAYDEGISHLIHAAKRNTDITLIVHDNSVFALTTGQFTATSPKGFKSKSSPKGSIEKPLDPLRVLLSAGATFVARGYVGRGDHLKTLIKEAVKHKGFSVVDVLQPCVAFNNTYSYYSQRVYELKNHNEQSVDEAYKKLSEWNGRIPIGIFYRKEQKTFEEELFKVNKP